MKYSFSVSVVAIGMFMGMLGYYVAGFFMDNTSATIAGIAFAVAVMLGAAMYLYQSEKRYRAFEKKYADRLVAKIKANCIRDGVVRKGCVYALEDTLCVVYGGSNPPDNLKVPYIDVEIATSENNELHIVCSNGNSLTFQSKEADRMAQQLAVKAVDKP